VSLLSRTWRAGERAEAWGTGREWERKKRVLRKRRTWEFTSRIGRSDLLSALLSSSKAQGADAEPVLL
jgi:hypothetical protein